MRRSIAFLTLALVFGLAACDSATDSLTDPGLRVSVTDDQTNARSQRGIVPRFIDNYNIPGEGADVCASPLVNPLGEDWLGFKVDSYSGTNQNGILVTITGNTYLRWDAQPNRLVRAVLVKGGQDSFVYDYNADAPYLFWDAQLRAPLNPGGNIPEISHYTVCYTEVEGAGEGCTPGYWKNHDGSGPQANAWVGYSPAATVGSVFSLIYSAPYASTSLADALNFGGGSGVDGAKRNLLRAAVAALLNAAHPDVDYELTTAQVIDQVDAALATGNRSTMLALAVTLDGYNNTGCPL